MEPTNQSNSSEDQSTRSRSQLADRVKQDSRERIERGKQVAADQVEQLADALDQAGSRLNDGQPTIASYATRLADGLDQLAQRLRRSSLEELARDTRAVAVRNPGAYLLGSAAVGLLLARFLKASIDTDAEGSSAGDFQSGSNLSSGGARSGNLGIGGAGSTSADFDSDAGYATSSGAATSGTSQGSAAGSTSINTSGNTGGAQSEAAGTAREPASTSRGIH